jgi:hypothetical protein
MSTEKSELHITDINRADKGLWVAAARLKNQTLAQWSIDALNRAESDQALAKHRIESGYYD